MQDTERGLSAAEVQKSREQFGANKIEQKKKKSFLRSYISNFSDPIIRVLLTALLINIVFTLPNINWFEAGGIAASVIISTLVSTYSEYSNENAFERLREQGESSFCEVRRDGERVKIPASELVVGDILLLNAGEKIQADGKILTGELSVNEAALTGESAEAMKNAESGEILKGSLVASGSAVARVTSVGEATYYGKTARELTADTRQSPLKHRLSVLAKAVSKLGYLAAGLIAIAYLFNVFLIDSAMNFSVALTKIKDIRFLISKLMSAITLAISVVVVAVPEGLPMMITVVLSSNMKKMMKDSVIVRKPVGIETSGNINLLFTDKTGTLTEGVLRMKEIRTLTGESFSSSARIPDGIYKKSLTLCALFCGDVEVKGGKVHSSNPTDRAISEFFKRENAEGAPLLQSPFDSIKKYASAVALVRGKRTTVFKGAPEKLISASVNYMDEYGNIFPLVSKEMCFGELRALSSRSYRVVALGIKDGDDSTLSGITFLGFTVLCDKIRHQVPGAVKTVTEAGVGVIMITGDNKDTAEAIAKECGIISPRSKRSRVLTGEELSLMTNEEIAELLPDIAVIARVLPTDKSRLVRVAQNSGYVVGMTGDGINDASSLKAADVGFAMGSGTDVAKEAGDIVISDNNFSSVTKAILYGRTIFESIRKFIVFQLTMNLGAVGISLIGPFIGVENPVTVSQMLWVNIIMDTLGALAFASEPPLYEYMRMKPKKREESILTKSMLKKIGLNGAYILALCIWFLKSDTLCMILHKSDEKYILSGFFAMFCFMSVFVCIISRTDRINIFANISKNPSFLTIMGLIVFIQIGLIYFGGEVFRSVPLLISDLLSIIIISSSVIVFDFIRKVFIKKTKRAYKGHNAHNV